MDVFIRFNQTIRKEKTTMSTPTIESRLDALERTVYGSNNTTNNTTNVDHTYIHNKKCELIKYLEHFRPVSDQMEEDIKRMLYDVAYNEKKPC